MYCTITPGADWENRTRDQNRTVLDGRLSCEEPAGVLAFARDEVVGWCHVARRALVPLFAIRSLGGLDDEERWGAAGAMDCLLVAPSFRRMGRRTSWSWRPVRDSRQRD